MSNFGGKNLKDQRTGSRCHLLPPCLLPQSKRAEILSVPLLFTSCLHLPSAGIKGVCHHHLASMASSTLYLSEHKQNIIQHMVAWQQWYKEFPWAGVRVVFYGAIIVGQLPLPPARDAKLSRYLKHAGKELPQCIW